MSILKTLFALVAIGWIGCEDKTINQTIVQCEQEAWNNCSKIGQRTNRVCYLAYARNCSTEDRDRAHRECLRIVGEVPTSSSNCILHWP